jgi:hypothetical protein
VGGVERSEADTLLAGADLLNYIHVRYLILD